MNLKGNPFFLDEKAIAWVHRTLDAMDDDARIGQLFVLETKDCDLDALRRKFEVVKPGGLMFRMNPAEAVRRTVEETNRWSDVPMLHAANLCNGGRDIADEGTLFASPMAAAATADPEMARRLGEVCGSEGVSVGVRWTFAPVADLDLAWRSPITNTRTFGSDAARTADMAAAFTSGVQMSGMAACMKHFPGDGVDDRDQHLTVTVNSLSCEEWDATYGVVYRRLIAEGAMSCMVGHITQPAWSRRLNPGLTEADCLPGSLSRELMTGLLRERLGFNGLIVTDDSQMAGMQIPMPRAQAVPASIAAGADMFLFQRDLSEDVGFMREGLRSGILSRERLTEAVTRILAMKAAVGHHLLNPDSRQTPAGTWPNEAHGAESASESAAGAVAGAATGAAAGAAAVLPERERHAAWAGECAERSITLVKDLQGLLPLSPVRHRRILFYEHVSGPMTRPGCRPGDGRESATDRFVRLMEAEGFEVTRWSRETGVAAGGSVKAVEAFDLLLHFVNVGWGGASGMPRIRWDGVCGDDSPLFGASVPTLAVSMNSPYMLIDMPRVKTFVNGYMPAPHFVDATIEKLMGRSPFAGVSPVDPFCGRSDTRL